MNIYRSFAPTTNKGQKIDGTLSDKLLVFIIKNAYNDILNIFFKEGGTFMNMGSKLDHRVTLRLNNDQYEFLLKVSELLGVSPSDYLRMSINSGMIASRSTLSDFISSSESKGVVGTNENVKTNSDYKL